MKPDSIASFSYWLGKPLQEYILLLHDVHVMFLLLDEVLSGRGLLKLVLAYHGFPQN